MKRQCHEMFNGVFVYHTRESTYNDVFIYRTVGVDSCPPLRKRIVNGFYFVNNSAFSTTRLEVI